MDLCVYETELTPKLVITNALIHLVLAIFDQSSGLMTKNLCLSVFTNPSITETECSAEVLPWIKSTFGLGS